MIPKTIPHVIKRGVSPKNVIKIYLTVV